MDIWIVAAAAGVGYVAQHLKSFVKGRQSLSASSCGSPTFAGSEKQQIGNAIHREKPCQEISSEREPASHDDFVTGMASTSRSYETPELCSGLANCTASTSANLLPSRSNGNSPTDKGARMHGDISEKNKDLSLQRYEQEMGVSYRFAKKKSNVRCRKSNRRVLKPLSSLESCLMAQLYKEQAEMEEYTFSFGFPSCTPAVRPFLVTDGTRIISRASNDSFSLANRSLQNKPHTDNCFLLEKATTSGVPLLPVVGSMDLHRKIKMKTRMEQNGKASHSSTSAMGKHQKLQGSSPGALLFGIGVSIGIMSSFLANKREVDKLSKLLKQTENLVQDLQEELEMKDSLTVKELAIEDYESQDTQNDAFNNGPLHAFSPEEKHDNYHKEYYNQKTDAESFSKIEAELEAELEMLELNMSSRRLEGKLSNVVELDTDDMPDVVKGELKADLFGGQDGDQPYADRDGSGSSTPHSANYALSPRELSLRLHEVIQSRLEERVEELERALQNSERKVKLMESERMIHWREFSNSESGTSSMQGSPVMNQHRHADQPVVINLSGNALNAYNEAYDEFAKMKEVDLEEKAEESPPSGLKQEAPLLQTFEQSTSWLHNGLLNGNSHHPSFTERTMLFSPPRSRRDNGTLPSDYISSGDQSDNDGDEMEEELIRHIVEKARKGSPAILNAQKVLFSLHENQH